MESRAPILRFGLFEFDQRTGELRKNGARVKLEGQPIQVLELLLERPQEVVTQEEIRARLWPDGTVVEFEHSIKSAIKRLRQALDDDAEAPRYVQTLPRRGYRFIAPVNVGARFGAKNGDFEAAATRAPLTLHSWPLWLAGSLAVILAALAVGWLVWRRAGTQPELTERQLTANPPEEYVWAAAISPDGKYAAYVDPTGLYLHSIDSGETHPVSVPAELRRRLLSIWWFPDGGRLLATAEGSDGGELWVITILGEAAPHLLYRHGGFPAISPDGQSIAFLSDNPERLRQVLVGGVSGETPRELVSAEEDQNLWSPVWSPDGNWIAYFRTWKTAQGSFSSAIEGRPVGGDPARTLVADSALPKSSSLGPLWGLGWSPDWRVLFPVTEASLPSATQVKYGLWAVHVESKRGEAASKPQQLAQTGDFFPSYPSITADGKRLSFIKTRTWSDVYLGELGPDGASLKPPRRFTLDNRGSRLNDCWTGDSQAILFDSSRNGRSEVFRQSLKDTLAEAVVEGPEDDFGAGPSSDGSWLLYVESTHTAPGAPPSPQRLMRRPIAGGSPELVLEEPAGVQWEFWCPLKPGSPCVLERTEGKDFVFYSLDPIRGKGGQLGKIEVSGYRTFSWGLSPDGSRLALVDSEKYKERIKVLTLSDHVWHEVSLEPGWGNSQSVAWAADGKGFFVISVLPDSFNLLHVTLDGKVKPLLRDDRQSITNPLPSPDGKYLAYEARTWDSNVWMLEGF